MDAAVKIGKRTIRLVNGIVSLFVLIVILLLLVFGCYAIWDSDQVYASAASARYTIYKPTAENQGLSFKELQAVNPEVFSWLTVYGTHIDYPVTQAKDNVKYINTDAKGNFALSGSIFLDAGNHPDFSDFNSILYGHHMAGQVMFGEIPLFADKNYFAARKYGMLHYGGKDYGLEFFAFIHDNAYDNSLFNVKIADSKSRQAYLSQIVKKAVQFRPEELPTHARGRLFCHARITFGQQVSGPMLVGAGRYFGVGLLLPEPTRPGGKDDGDEG